MKATMDIPDDLYRRVKAKTALEGLTVREVAVAFFTTWVGDAPSQPAAKQATREPTTPAWFGSARRYAAAVARHDMDAIRSSIATGRREEHARTTGKDGRTP